MIRQRHPLGIATVLAALGLAAPAPPAGAQTAPAATAPPPGPAVVEVVAEDYAFSAPDRIPSGWTTIRFRNEGQEPHFVYMSRLPEGRTIEEYERELSVPYSRGWYALRDGRADAAEALAMVVQALPEWYGGVQVAGGPGLAAPGEVSEVTLNLEPGYYVLECYMKTEDGEIHMMDGMVRPLVVTEQRSAATPPAADIRVTLSNFAMAVEGDLAPGRRTVAVHVAENPDEGFGHSVHVARLEPGTEAGEVVRWMNWFDTRGLRTPAPARFVGGMHPIPAGSTAYFTVDLEPGRYLWVSEATGSQGVRREVTVR